MGEEHDYVCCVDTVAAAAAWFEDTYDGPNGLTALGILEMNTPVSSPTATTQTEAITFTPSSNPYNCRFCAGPRLDGVFAVWMIPAVQDHNGKWMVNTLTDAEPLKNLPVYNATTQQLDLSTDWMWGTSWEGTVFRQTAANSEIRQTQSLIRQFEDGDSDATSVSFVFEVTDASTNTQYYCSEVASVDVDDEAGSTFAYLSLDARGLSLTAKCGLHTTTVMLMCFGTLASAYVMGSGSIRMSVPASLTWRMYDTLKGHHWKQYEIFTVLDAFGGELTSVSLSEKAYEGKFPSAPVFGVLQKADGTSVAVFYDPRLLLLLYIEDVYPPVLTYQTVLENDAILYEFADTVQIESSNSTGSENNGNSVFVPDYSVRQIQIKPTEVQARYYSSIESTGYSLTSSFVAPCALPATNACTWLAGQGNDCCDTPPDDPWAPFSLKSTYVGAKFQGPEAYFEEKDTHTYTYYSIDDERQVQYPIKTSGNGTCVHDDDSDDRKCYETLSNAQRYLDRSQTVGVREALVCDPRIADPPGRYSTEYGYGLGPRWMYAIQGGPYLSAPQWKETGTSTGTTMAELRFDKVKYYECIGGTASNPYGSDSACAVPHDRWACSLALVPDIFVTLVTNEMAYYSAKGHTTDSSTYPEHSGTNFKWSFWNYDVTKTGGKCLFFETGNTQDMKCFHEHFDGINCFGNNDANLYKNAIDAKADYTQLAQYCKPTSTCNTTTPRSAADYNTSASVSSEVILAPLYVKNNSALSPTSIMQLNGVSGQCGFNRSDKYGAAGNVNTELTMLSTSGSAISAGDDDSYGLCCAMQSLDTEYFCKGPMSNMASWHNAPRPHRYAGTFGPPSFRALPSSRYDYTLAYDHVSAIGVGGIQSAQHSSHHEETRQSTCSLAFGVFDDDTKHHDNCSFPNAICATEHKQFDKCSQGYPTNSASAWSWGGAINYELILAHAFSPNPLDGEIRERYQFGEAHAFPIGTSVAMLPEKRDRATSSLLSCGAIIDGNAESLCNIPYSASYDSRQVAYHCLNTSFVSPKNGRT